MDEDGRSAAKLFYRYICDKFRKPARKDIKTYLITTAYSNIVFDSKANIDGIYFPSVPYERKGVNFAIGGDFDFRNSFELELAGRDTFIREDNGNVPGFKQNAAFHFSLYLVSRPPI